MHLVKIHVSYQGSNGKFSVSYKDSPECKETDLSFSWKGIRVNKMKIGIIDTVTKNDALDYMSFFTWSLPDEESIAANTNTLKLYLLCSIMDMARKWRDFSETVFRATGEKSLEDIEWVEKHGE